ncbi:transcriptional regulator [Sphingomonas koreensis]|nr:transcriptional regulator [Sphingomonas koreensis]
MVVASAALPAKSLIQLAAGEASLYGQFCPVAMAAELLATRWTLVVLGEMLSGSTRFNEIRRGVPRMSSALLVKRLRELEAAGVLVCAGGEYLLTAAGRDLAPIVQGLGRWALRWAETDCSLGNLDVRLLMWNMRRNLRPNPMPARRVVVEFSYPELPEGDRRFWLIVAPGSPVDLCSIEPGHEVDLLVTAQLRAMTSAWMGISAFQEELDENRIELDGDPLLSATFTTWIGRSGLAGGAQDAVVL